MAAGHHHAGEGFQLVRGKIQHRGGNAANVNHVNASSANAIGQAACQCSGPDKRPSRPMQMAVHLAQARFATDGAADQEGGVGSQGVADNATDIVGLENGLCDGHGKVSGIVYV